MVVGSDHKCLIWHFLILFLFIIINNKNKYHFTGTYAFRLPENDEGGIWVSYEDPDTAGQKASFVK